MNIADRFVISTDPHNWIVTPRVIAAKGKNKGQTVDGENSYFPNLLQCCQHVMDRDAAAAASAGIPAVIAALRDSERVLRDAIAGTQP